MIDIMVMEAKCCENAIQVTRERAAEELLPVLRAHAATLPFEARREFVKSLVRASNLYYSLIDTLDATTAARNEQSAPLRSNPPA